MDAPAIDADPAIEVTGLVKDFGHQRALDGLTFTVPRGQLCALLGANGAGKTTTIHVLLGLTTPTAGRARVLGHDMTRDRTPALLRCNFTASYVSLPARLHVGEILRVFAEYYEVPDPRQAIDEVVEMFGIGPLLRRRAQLLSSGQLTLVGLAKAFVNRPELLFLDEPTASLDPEHAHGVRQTLRHLATERSMTILVTSHNMVEVERIADRVLLLSGGRIAADATVDGLRQQFQAADLEEVFLQVARRGRAAQGGGPG